MKLLNTEEPPSIAEWTVWIACLWCFALLMVLAIWDKEWDRHIEQTYYEYQMPELPGTAKRGKIE